jgi:hypothetical protein
MTITANDGAALALAVLWQLARALAVSASVQSQVGLLGLIRRSSKIGAPTGKAHLRLG